MLFRSGEYKGTQIYKLDGGKFANSYFIISNQGTIIWKQTSDMIVGDTVYIYMAAPISAVMYRCEAVEVNIPYNYDDGKYRIKKAVKLRLVHRYRAEDMPLAKMRELGVSAVRGARGVPNVLACELRRLSG